MKRNVCSMPGMARRRGGWVGRSVLATGALLTLVAGPVSAQRDQARVAGESQFEIEIENLARQLLSKRVSLENLTRALQGLHTTLRAGELPDSLRPRFEASIRQNSGLIAEQILAGSPDRDADGEEPAED